MTAATPKKPRYTDAGYSGRRATSALTNRRRHGRSYPGARVRWDALRGSRILPTPNQLLPTVRREHFEKASRSASLAVAIQRVCTEHTLDSRVLTTTLVDQRRRQHPVLELPAA